MSAPGRSPDHATIEIKGPGGSAYIQSVDPSKVEIGSINIGDGEGVEIHTQGSAEVGELNVGMDAVVASETQEAIQTESGAFALFAIVAIIVVFAAITVICWRALAQR